jgi:hypothetical protein
VARGCKQDVTSNRQVPLRDRTDIMIAYKCSFAIKIVGGP